MCRYRPLQAEAEAMMPVEEISDDSSMVDIARIDIKVVRAAEGMEARFGSDDICFTQSPARSIQMICVNSYV